MFHLHRDLKTLGQFIYPSSKLYYLLPKKNKNKNSFCTFLIQKKKKLKSGCNWLISWSCPAVLVCALSSGPSTASSPRAVLSFQPINEHQPKRPPPASPLAVNCLPILLFTTLTIQLGTLKQFNSPSKAACCCCC